MGVETERQMSPNATCTNLNGLLATEKAAIRCHLDAHLFVAQPTERREAVRSFIEGYGGLMRELYCAHICPDRARCEVMRIRLPDCVEPRPQAG